MSWRIVITRDNLWHVYIHIYTYCFPTHHIYWLPLNINNINVESRHAYLTTRYRIPLFLLKWHYVKPGIPGNNSHSNVVVQILWKVTRKNTILCQNYIVMGFKRTRTSRGLVHRLNFLSHQHGTFNHWIKRFYNNLTTIYHSQLKTPYW